MPAFIDEIVGAIRRVPVALGLGVAIVLNAIDGWWLDAGDRVRHMIIVLGVVALVVGVRWGSRPWWRSPCDLWLGFMVGTAGVLAILGLGNIFPIVLTVGAGLSGGAILTGWSVGALLRATLHKART